MHFENLIHGTLTTWYVILVGTIFFSAIIWLWSLAILWLWNLTWPTRREQRVTAKELSVQAGMVIVCAFLLMCSMVIRLPPEELLTKEERRQKLLSPWDRLPLDTPIIAFAGGTRDGYGKYHHVLNIQGQKDPITYHHAAKLPRLFMIVWGPHGRHYCVDLTKDCS